MSTRADLTMLIDASNLIYRAYFAVPDTVRAPDGRAVNAAYGFLNMLARLIGEYRPAWFACAWDDDWRPQWRVDLIESYKTHRVATEEADEAEESIEDQIPLIAEMLDIAGIAVVGSPQCEAEDVIGTLAARARGAVAIVSGDRDLFQLVRDPDVFVLYPRKGVTELWRVTESEIASKYGIPGRAYADFAILRGDPSDGLPGVRGIGEKTAAALIAAHGNLDAVVAAADGATSGPLAKVARALDYIERARKVVMIPADVPIGTVDITLPSAPIDPELLRTASTAHGLVGVAARLVASMRADSRRQPP